ncbi:MAG: M20/M25/M40 family metallo-hydrolase [Clostridiaceae bacterium]|nr:M20/M25/M40 family metallo-hydrolase [Clostridiaceae bacterium]
MINKERLVENFCDLVMVDSVSKQERLMADIIKEELTRMGYSPKEDKAGEAIGGNAGNVIVKIPGTINAEPLLFVAHMDTVEPGHGKVPVIDGDIIKSDGNTVLGGDDLAGVACILEAIRVIREQNIPHGDVYAVFTIAEEIGLLGAKELDVSKIPAKFAYVLDDSGPVGSAAIRAPYYNQFSITIKGKSAHAGLCPEKGTNAIYAAAKAIASLPFMGRIDEDTTCNIGVINGGRSRNIVPDEVTMEGEIRSIYEDKINKYTKHITDTIEKVATGEGCTVKFDINRNHDGYNIPEDHPVLLLMKEATDRLGIKLSLHSTGGLSDTTVINNKGIPAVDISIGMTNVHCTQEQIAISDLVKVSSLLIEIIRINGEKGAVV